MNDLHDARAKDRAQLHSLPSVDLDETPDDLLRDCQDGHIAAQVENRRCCTNDALFHAFPLHPRLPALFHRRAGENHEKDSGNVIKHVYPDKKVDDIEYFRFRTARYEDMENLNEHGEFDDQYG
jgi:hypothetical protein